MSRFGKLIRHADADIKQQEFADRARDGKSSMAESGCEGAARRASLKGARADICGVSSRRELSALELVSAIA
jgi:hypothetical protein